MSATRYSKYEPTLDDLDMADLMKMIQDRLLESGFQRNPWGPRPELSADHARPLRRHRGGSYQQRTRFGRDDRAGDGKRRLDGLAARQRSVKELAQRLEREGYLKPQEGTRARRPQPARRTGADKDPTRPDPGQVKFELTNKAIDFLGYRTLKDVLGGAGKSSIGAHETQFQTTGVEATAESKPYDRVRRYDELEPLRDLQERSAARLRRRQVRPSITAT